jgi:hypothetical protein
MGRSVSAGAHAYLGPRPAVRRAGDMMVMGCDPGWELVRPLDLSGPSTRDVAAAECREPAAAHR